MLSSMPSARADRALSSCGPIRADIATASAALERRLGRGAAAAPQRGVMEGWLLRQYKYKGYLPRCTGT